MLRRRLCGVERTEVRKFRRDEAHSCPMKLVVLGAGQMGTAIVHDLLAQTDVKQVAVADASKKSLQTLRKRLTSKRLSVHQLDVTQPRKLGAMIANAACVVGATPATPPSCARCSTWAWLGPNRGKSMT